jgi:hypothetical protein
VQGRDVGRGVEQVKPLDGNAPASGVPIGLLMTTRPEAGLLAWMTVFTSFFSSLGRSAPSPYGG